MSFLDVLRCAAIGFEDDPDENETILVDMDKLCNWLCPAVADLDRLKQRVRQFLKGAADDLQARSKGEKNLSEHDAALAIFDTMDSDAGGDGHVTAEMFRRAVGSSFLANLSLNEVSVIVCKLTRTQNRCLLWGCPYLTRKRVH